MYRVAKFYHCNMWTRLHTNWPSGQEIDLLPCADLYGPEGVGRTVQKMFCCRIHVRIPPP